MRPLLPPVCLLLTALTVGGCTSAEKKLEKQEQAIIRENSRVTEQRKMNAINYGDAGSQRGADVLVWDPNKKFDPNRSGVGAARTFGTGGSRTKDFNYVQKTKSGNFLTRAFGGSKGNYASEKDYATTESNSKREYVIPGTTMKTDKALPVKDVSDGSRSASVRDLPDGDRQFLGREQKKLSNAIDPVSLADWRKAGAETVIYRDDGSVERMGALKQLSINDVRELLNKNK